MGIRDLGGIWTFNENDIRNLFVNSFVKLYKAEKDIESFDDFMQCESTIFESISTSLSPDDFDHLNKQFCAKEVRKAVFQLCPLNHHDSMIVTKCISNRLSKVMPKLVGEFQNAFVPGRNISDNILIANELFRKISSSKFGKYGKMAFKADMSKAYDRLNWHFIRATLVKMRFPDWTIKLIMKCIYSVSYEILINGIPSQKIIPWCGLRQGDPLSPYIFVICTEVLSQCLRKEERLGTIKGIQIFRGSQAISHLFFADDSIFFLEGKSSSSCSTLASTISNYCRGSGKRINEAKCAIIISPSSSLSFAQDCFKIFRVSPTAEMGKYLEFPTDIGISEYGKSKRDIFNFLIDNVKKRMSSWNGLLLSSAGRLSLISSILSSLSTYFLSVFKMPDLGRLRGSRTSKSISWRSKLFLNQPKGLGGLGIRNTRCFNQALLAKIGWNMLHDPSSLISRTIGVQLGLDWTNCINCVETVKSKDSWICKGILWGAKTFTKHIAWMVDSESSTLASVKDLSRISSGCRAFIKKWLWHLPGPKRWIILLWKILTQTLSVARELEKRGIGDGFFCRLCDRQCVESLEHLFRDYEFVSRLWSANHLGINANSVSNISIQEWIINWLSLLSRKENSIDGVISFMCTIWTIWVTRNTHVYSNEPLSPSRSIHLYEHELSLMIYAEKERADSRKDLNNTCLLDDDDFNLKVLHNGNTFPLIGPDLCENHYLIYTDAV
ncbi:uncharacterized protein LOC141628862 [Silene latifolia]|uniref:uncharacterized protein LOC141628862 n=1 Tax=Silene latifolia TaxID=37657 RepID=UPI003D776E4F